MQLWDVFSDPYIIDYMSYLSQYALESPYPNFRVQVDTITLSCTANTLASQAVTFNKQYAYGTAPVLFLFANPSIPSSSAKPTWANLNNTGFTAQVYSDTTQSVTVNYIAIGQVGGA
jgi:hypothetical protein